MDKPRKCVECSGLRSGLVMSNVIVTLTRVLARGCGVQHTCVHGQADVSLVAVSLVHHGNDVHYGGPVHSEFTTRLTIWTGVSRHRHCSTSQPNTTQGGRDHGKYGQLGMGLGPIININNFIKHC